MAALERFDIDYLIRNERFYRDTAQWEKLRSCCECRDRTLQAFHYINCAHAEQGTPTRPKHS